MRCVNPSCREELDLTAEQTESAATFCPYCGAEVPLLSQAGAGGTHAGSPGGNTVDPFTGQVVTAAPVVQVAPRTVAAVQPQSVNGSVLEMRDQNETEREVRPGEQRPLVIIDEHTEHLAHTDQRLTPEELLNRVSSIISAQQVPVNVRMVKARWMRDAREVRPRIVASLRDHPYSDIKMILGVDYMGRWASIQLHLGAELDPIPQEPPLPPWKAPVDAIIALILGVVLLLFIVGIIPIIYAAWRFYTSYTSHNAKLEQERRNRAVQQAYKERARAEERLSRTFKVDDMRLFCTAMNAVFRAVVDDIVRRGGEVVRVEGGKGGFFEAEEAEAAPIVPRRTDAAAAEV